MATQAIIKSIKLEQHKMVWVADVVYLRSDREGECSVTVHVNSYYLSSALVGLPMLIEDEIRSQGVDEVMIAVPTRLN